MCTRVASQAGLTSRMGTTTRAHGGAGRSSLYGVKCSHLVAVHFTASSAVTGHDACSEASSVLPLSCSDQKRSASPSRGRTAGPPLPQGEKRAVRAAASASGSAQRASA